MHPLYCGIEVSAKTLDICLSLPSGGNAKHQVLNTPAGHRQLASWVLRHEHPVRACMEATGVYGLDLALSLDENPSIEIMVANPRAARRFAEALMRRAKTDGVDAEMLRQFAERMPFVPWQPPSSEILALRAITRRIQSLTQLCAGEKNRLHAAKVSRTTPSVVTSSIRRQIRNLTREIDRLGQQAIDLIQQHDELKARHQLLLTIPGIGQKTAPLLLAELGALPEGLEPRQWVAHAGLDPKPRESGSSLCKPRQISKAGNKRIRAALYMPALVAVRCDPHLRAFYQKLQQRGLEPIQALVAVMRKLLHAINGIWCSDQDFDARKLLPNIQIQP